MKKRFILDVDYLEVLDLMSDPEIAELFKAIRDYHLEKPVNLPSVSVRIVFHTFECLFKRSNEAYEKKILLQKKIIEDVNLTKSQREYRTYLKSPYWLNICKLILERDNNKCQSYGKGKNLHVHHKTYENVRRELDHLDDLVALCKSCHTLIHANI